MGFMLVFRWNNAYERWWSGRTELGLLLMHCKNLGGQFCTWVAPDDQQLATRALALICALKECVADRLNGTVLRWGRTNEFETRFRLTHGCETRLNPKPWCQTVDPNDEHTLV